jgi:sarcosine oxidase subunit beta
VAVLERGWIGGGNTGRNTTVIRSNYLREPAIRFQDENLRLWEGLSRELNFNLMVSPRGQLEVIQTWGKLRDARRRVHAMRLAGADYELLDADEVYRRAPLLRRDAAMRLPVLGGAWQGRAGTVRHDAVVWAYARAARALGVDIVEQCEVTGLLQAGGAVTGVRTARGDIACDAVAVAVAGQAGRLAAMAGLRLPVETLNLQAFVSEPLKPMLDVVLTFPALSTYLSQSDKGELVIGSGTDQYVSYSQRGGLPLIEHTVAAICEVFPIFNRMRMLRKWGGIVDVTPDRSPILGKLPVKGLYVNCGWGTGGFKATPGAGHLLAWTVAKDEPHPINAPFTLERFTTGRLIDEAAAAAVAH